MKRFKIAAINIPRIDVNLWHEALEYKKFFFKELAEKMTSILLLNLAGIVIRKKKKVLSEYDQDGAWDAEKFL